MLTQNHFELLGLPAVYAIDQATLTSRYRDLQNSVHPDRYANASDQERRLSMQRAAQINEAFNTLKDPLRRAAYLLELAGIDLEAKGSTMDPAFLMEQMELREQLAEIRSADDPLEQVAGLIDGLAHQLREMSAQLEALFSAHDAESLSQAADQVRKMQFLYKLQEEANALEADLEDELL
jgi:molecular chaperone HscB